MQERQYINPKFPHLIHGGDYNPEQWMDYPGIWDEDMRLMKLAEVNSASVGIFSWAELEPFEGVFDFSFLDRIMDKLAENDISVVLATPSGARPAWMSYAHPEVLRVNADRTKNLHGERHNHCYTSPYYRKKTSEINRRLAERYKNHPALTVWHISNEYGGECHCELCREAFREWLKVKYNNDLSELNHQYWAKFWSHTYTDWAQVEPPSPIGETNTHGLTLDWRRFVTCQTVDFMKNEIAPLKEITPDIPVTTNLMGTYFGLDYFKFKDISDVISWDSYPAWHSGNDVALASDVAFLHDLNRSIKGRPFMLMESTPSIVNWNEVNKQKRPGMHILSSIQAVAHGADTVQYFQWRKSRGSSEKLHGAVVDHCGHENTRVFREVAELGGILKKLSDVAGTRTTSEVAVIFDWENHWAIDSLLGLGADTKRYEATCKAHYNAFWKRGISVDVIDSDCDFSRYKLISAPMLYMTKPGVIEKIRDFVKDGGTFVATYLTGWVNENDLCHLGGFPGGELKDVFGIWSEELDSLWPQDSNSVKTADGAAYSAVEYCEVIHPKTAQTLAVYEEDYYAGMAAVTQNAYGKGTAYYIAFRDTGEFTDGFYGKLISELGLAKNIDAALPDGVTVSRRGEYVFLQNFSGEERVTELNASYEDVINDKTIKGAVSLEKYGFAVLKEQK